MSDADIAQRVRTHLNKCIHRALLKLSRLQAPEPITIRVADDFHAVIVLIAPVGQCATCPMELECRNHSPDGEPDSIRERICQHLTSEPQTRARVARLAGCKLNSHFRQIVADMIREGTIIDTPDGIKIADSP